MLTKGVLDYIATLYGILVGITLPLIYLYSRLYFRKNRFGFRAMMKYLGWLLIMFALYGLILGTFIIIIENFGSRDSVNIMIESPWYFIGFLIGLIGAILLSKVTLRRAQKAG